jgi:glycosyltransferase involved in cell wall biosynthesis
VQPSPSPRAPSAPVSPGVSVCIPVYNTERFIAAAIDSVLAQTWTSFELVVVDNASTDRTPAILEHYADPRIRVYRNAENIGAAGNFNRAVGLAEGRYLKILCADDVLYPECLERQVTVLEQDVDERIALVGGGRDIIDAAGRRWLSRGTASPPGRTAGAAAIAATVRSGTNVFGEPAAVMMRTAAARAAGAFDPAFSFCLDLDLWCRLLATGDLYMIPETLCGFRISDQSWSATIAGRQHREFARFITSLDDRGVSLSGFDRFSGRTRAVANALLRQAVTRMLLWSSRLR